MKYRKTISLALCFVLTFVSAEERGQKHFSLFSVVTFKNEPCAAKSTAKLTGTCTTSEDCKGTKDGNCAAGFGVCCVNTVNVCGSSVTKNCTYIDNPGYPTNYATAQDCSYTVTRVQDDICQVRLDFFEFVTMQPSATAATAGICANTILAITPGTTSQSMTTKPPQKLCGTLTGQHLYLDSGRQNTAATLKFTTIAASTTNKWRIKVSQIECGNPARAPPGCLQYFYAGPTQTWTSFNWDGTKTCVTGCMLANTLYSVCFRPEKGYCGNSYIQTPTEGTKDAWDLPDAITTETTTIESGAQEQGAAACLGGALHIPNHNSLTQDQFCGSGYLSEVDGSVAPGRVYAIEAGAWAVDVNIITDIESASAGWSVNSIQTPCK